MQAGAPKDVLTCFTLQQINFHQIEPWAGNPMLAHDICSVSLRWATIAGSVSRIGRLISTATSAGHNNAIHAEHGLRGFTNGKSSLRAR